VREVLTMCGIAGIFLKNAALEPKLGAMLSEMLDVLSDRGPDSAGFAVYGYGESGQVKFTLRGKDAGAMKKAATALKADLAGSDIAVRDSHAVVTMPAAQEESFRKHLAERFPELQLVGVGTSMELYKEVGLPASVSKRFALEQMSGTHAIGHTRMATESAVTTKGAHPFSTGADQCLVHNGSLSNHNAVRRELKREGISFETDNDSEVAAGYLTLKMREGASLPEALKSSLKDLDGFYTFVVGTQKGFAVLRDPIACKPAVMAETDDYVAFGSEYRALAVLPGIENARVFEPEPATVYAWERA
jgi:methylamine---glutamate N-methyltransferase subunit A